MEQPVKTCPKCGSGEYTLRSRKKIEAAAGKEAAIETKYRGKSTACLAIDRCTAETAWAGGYHGVISLPLS
jgi:hypothetical protein